MCSNNGRAVLIPDMAGTVKRKVPRKTNGSTHRGLEEPPFVKWALIGVALLFCTVFLLLPLVNVFVQAFAKGWSYYITALKHPNSWASIRLTLIVAAVSVPLNVLFGLAAAWAIAKFNFR